MMTSRSRKKEVIKPLASIVTTVPAEKVVLPPPSALLLSTNQPRPTSELDPATIEQELQALRQGTHPGFLTALDALDQAQQEHVFHVHRLKEERLRNVEEMFVAEMQAVEDDYREEAEELREKMMEELISKSKEQGGPKVEMVTRKRAKLTTKDERPKKRQTVKGIRFSLSNEEISGDLESIRQQMTGLGGSTRSKTKL